jgi:hypothetical protein
MVYYKIIKEQEGKMSDNKRTELNSYLSDLIDYLESDLKLMNETARKYLARLDVTLEKCSLMDKLSELWGEEWETPLKNLINEEKDKKNHIQTAHQLSPKLEQITRYLLDLTERACIISDHYDSNRFPNIHLFVIQMAKVNELIKD